MSSVLITGGAVGLGGAIAIHMASKGYNVALHYHVSSPDSTVSQISALGVQCKTYYADLTKGDIGFFRQVALDFPDLSVLVNNASTFDKTGYADLTEDAYDSSFNINVRNPIFLSQAFMQLGQAELIINMSDALAEKKSTDLFIHALTKNTLIGTTKMLSSTLAPTVPVTHLLVSR